MSRGTPAMVGALGVLSLGVICVAAVVVVVFGIRPGDAGERLPFVEAAWQSLMRTLDSGTMGGDEGWAYRVVMLAVTLGGVFIISALIGVVSAGIDARIESLRQGRSRVVEAGHILVLGWSPKIFTVLSEIAAANETVRRPCAVVLGPEDKVAMETAIRERVDARNLRIVCRNGNPLDPNDLRLGRPERARSIIVLPSEDGHGDIHAIKTLLALAQIQGADDGTWHVVAAVREEANAAAARLASGPWAHILRVDDFVARITAQTCRQSGLSIVLQELLDFGGDELYFGAAGAASGRTYGWALHALRGGTGLGVQHADGTVVLNPPAATLLGATDRLVVIAADDDAFAVAADEAVAVDAGALAKPAPRPIAPERSLVLGWNHRGHRFVAELNAYVAAGSTVHVVAHPDDRSRPRTEALSNLTLTFEAGDPCDRPTLDRLDVPSFDHVIVLAGDGHDDHHVTDARTLVTLLHLRDIGERSGRAVAIVSEMLDVRNRDLAVVTRADDFIVSDRLVSLMLVQLAENPALEAVFADLFDPSGCEIYLKAASDYVAIGPPVSFHTVIESALARGETAIGFRIAAHAADAARHHGVVLNPDKSQPVRFAAGDRIIVLAES